MNWMEYIRNNPENAYRFSENFWPSQIESKKWLLEHVTPMDRSIVIFGGWYEETGCPMLLNTSLNIKGFPMVNDEKDAKMFAEIYKVKVF